MQYPQPILGVFTYLHISRDFQDLRPRHGLGHPVCRNMPDVAQIFSRTLPFSQSEYAKSPLTILSVLFHMRYRHMVDGTPSEPLIPLRVEGTTTWAYEDSMKPYGIP